MIRKLRVLELGVSVIGRKKEKNLLNKDLPLKTKLKV